MSGHGHCSHAQWRRPCQTFCTQLVLLIPSANQTWLAGKSPIYLVPWNSHLNIHFVRGFPIATFDYRRVFHLLPTPGMKNMKRPKLQPASIPRRSTFAVCKYEDVNRNNGCCSSMRSQNRLHLMWCCSRGVKDIRVKKKAAKQAKLLQIRLLCQRQVVQKMIKEWSFCTRCGYLVGQRHFDME